MIFVSVGTQEKPFNRLIQGVDEIADMAGEKIIIQSGHSTYIPRKCEYFRFCDHEQMLSYMKDARFIISHSGFGIIGNSIRLGKSMILVPREIAYGEAIDKQYELAEYLAGQYQSIICVRNIVELPSAVERIRNVKADYHYSTTIPALIEEFISDTFR